MYEDEGDPLATKETKKKRRRSENDDDGEREGEWKGIFHRRDRSASDKQMQSSTAATSKSKTVDAQTTTATKKMKDATRPAAAGAAGTKSRRSTSPLAMRRNEGDDDSGGENTDDDFVLRSVAGGGASSTKKKSAAVSPVLAPLDDDDSVPWLDLPSVVVTPSTLPITALHRRRITHGLTVSCIASRESLTTAFYDVYNDASATGRSTDTKETDHGAAAARQQAHCDGAVTTAPQALATIVGCESSASAATKLAARATVRGSRQWPDAQHHCANVDIDVADYGTSEKRWHNHSLHDPAQVWTQAGVGQREEASMGGHLR
jgi:hypothetical protein